MRSLKLLAFLFLLCTFAWADSQVRIVRLSLVDGPVQLDRNTGEGFQRAIMNMPIAQGMQLWTRDDSRAEVEFEDGNTLRLSPGTKVEFTTLALRNDGSRSTVIQIDSGRAYVDYNRKSGEDFRVHIGNKEIALTDSVHFRADVANDRAELAVLSGELKTDSDLRVKKNNTAILDLSSGTFQLAKGVDPVLEDAWDKYRTDYHDKYAKSAYKGSSFYGRSDLNYYGGWMDTSFGSCWRPYGFDASWSPYSAGAWAYYPGYGYTFVSAYPWGWQPFHYGVWNYAGSTAGWCWTPNNRFYGYGYAPVYTPYGYAVVQAPGRPRPPQRVGGAPNRPWQDGTNHGLIPVGNIDTTTWRAQAPGARPWSGGHQHGGAAFVGGGSVTGGGGVAVTPRTAAAVNGASELPRDSKGRVVNPDDARAIREAQREQYREMRREEHQQQRAMQQQQQRTFERGAGPSMRPTYAPAPRMSASEPGMSAASPRMSSAPSAAPAAAAPRMSSPEGGRSAGPSGPARGGPVPK